MDKREITLPTTKWGTLKSKYKPESNFVSNDEFTAGSYNFLTNVNGAITKRPTDIVYNASAFTNVAKDQFEAIFNNGTHHLLLMDGGSLKYTTGDTLFSTASSSYTAIASMEYCMFQNRVYFGNGVDNPGIYDITTTYGSVTYTPPQVRSMGATPPAGAVTFAADSGSTGVPTGGYYYKVTYLYYGFEESNGGTISALHTVSGGPKNVNLTGIPQGGYGVTARNIYRATDSGGTPGAFLLVGTIPNNLASVTTFIDTASAGSTPIPVSNNLPPIFSYIALNLSRLWVAGVSGTPSELYWSNPGLPDLFDPDNSLQCNPGDPIQAIYIYQGITVVFNRHSMGQVLGTTDDTFYYQPIPGSVGCVDNRSIQIRTLDGVPTLMWLSDRGVYSFNGSNVTYMSDAIEDEVSLNIQQVNFVTGSQAYSTLSDWQSALVAPGVISPAVDYTTNPGTITTIDPTKSFQSKADWEGGSLTNIATLDGSNSMKVPLKFWPTLSQGTFGGNAYQSYPYVTLPTVADYTGASTVDAYMYRTLNGGSQVNVAYPFVLPRDGTVTHFSGEFRRASAATGTLNVKVTIWSDALGSPGAILHQGANQAFVLQTPGGNYIPFDFVNSVISSYPLTGGTTYWIGISGTSNNPFSMVSPKCNFSGQAVGKYNPGSSWQVIGTDTNSVTNAGSIAYTSVQTAIPSSGSWNSPVYDTYALGVDATTYNSVGSYPTSTTGTARVYSSTDQINWINQAIIVNPTGTSGLGGGGYRYWYVSYTLSTTDNRRVPSMTSPTVSFNAVGTWISPAFELTTDATSFLSMPVVNNIPANTSVVYTIATSANQSGPWSGTGNADGQFGPLGSAVLRRWSKIKAVLTATSTGLSTPSVNSIILNWTIVATYASSALNIGQTPSGWGLFQDSANPNGGTLSFSMRSATSIPNLSSATYYTVTNGTFPDSSILPLQYAQFRVILTASPGNLPIVDSVTLNWFTGGTASPIRVASIFVQKTYFLAAAEIGQPQNNIVIVYDQEGLWRLFRNININSLSLFFNQPFYCDAIRKYLYQWLVPPTGTSDAVMMDVRTKAFDLDLLDNLKSVRSCRIIGTNTGTTIRVYYSIDRGTTWIEMLNTAGTTGYTTTTDGTRFSEYFVADYASGAAVSGTTVIFRVVSADNFPCEIYQIKPCLYIRKGKYIQEAI